MLAFILIAAILCTMLSATIGVTSLSAAGLVRPGFFGPTWRAWWIGDALAALLITPALLSWRSRIRKRGPRRLTWTRTAEGGAICLSLAMVATSVFFRTEGAPASPLDHPFLMFPFLTWAAIRFELRGATAATLLLSIIAISGTALGHGPFVEASLAGRLLAVQTFLGVIAIMTLVLGGAIAEARHTSEAREEFLSVASHELRTPLTSLQLQVQALLRNAQRGRTDALTLERLQGNLEIIGRQGDRLEQLIDDLLNVTRIAAGQLTLHSTDTDLSRVVHEVTERLQEQARRSGSILTVRCDGPVPGRWDVLRLGQVITNLVSNAIKYGAGKPIEVRAEALGPSARVTVRDQGVGIAVEHHARIFERFERVTPGHYGGLGLGLWIVRQIVIRMRGTIRVESKLAHGTTFVVDLPCALPGDEDHENQIDSGRR